MWTFALSFDFGFASAAVEAARTIKSVTSLRMSLVLEEEVVGVPRWLLGRWFRRRRFLGRLGRDFRDGALGRCLRCRALGRRGLLRYRLDLRRHRVRFLLGNLCLDLFD